MTNEELKNSFTQIFPAVTFDETGEFLNAIIPSEELLPVMKVLRSSKEFLFDYLFCLTCVDWKDHLMMVYFLKSNTHNHIIVVKAKITDTINPQIESVYDIWKTAELNEDEVFDLFGVNFLNHPNLRRIFLEEDWVGYPLRKNYVDEHMIEL
jgi:NADH:ubiquinone oxidoreductase subunit C